MSKAKLTNKLLKGRIYGREQGEMPIGPVLIIALIVLPLVFLLVTYGGQLGESFAKASSKVTSGATEAGITANTTEAFSEGE